NRGRQVSIDSSDPDLTGAERAIIHLEHKCRTGKQVQSALIREHRQRILCPGTGGNRCRKAAGQSLSTPTLIEVQRVISIDIYMKKIILPFLFISAKNNATLIPLSNGQRDLVGHIAKMSGGGKTALQKALERLFDLVSTI